MIEISSSWKSDNFTIWEMIFEPIQKMLSSQSRAKSWLHKSFDDVITFKSYFLTLQHQCKEMKHLKKKKIFMFLNFLNLMHHILLIWSQLQFYFWTIFNFHQKLVCINENKTYLTCKSAWFLTYHSTNSMKTGTIRA